MTIYALQFLVCLTGWIYIDWHWSRCRFHFPLIIELFRLVCHLCSTVRSLVHSCHVMICVTVRLLILFSALCQFCFTVIIDPLLLHSSPCSSSSISCRDPSSLGNIPQLVVCKNNKNKKKEEEKNTVCFQPGCLQEWIIASLSLFHHKTVLLLCLCFIVRSHRTAVIALLSLFDGNNWTHSYRTIPQRRDMQRDHVIAL